jgi:hypothetical protein
LIQNEEYFLSRYIHLNPREILGEILGSYPWSSYQIYLNKIKYWIKDIILNNFIKNVFINLVILNFVENYKEKSEEEYKAHTSLLD